MKKQSRIAVNCSDMIMTSRLVLLVLLSKLAILDGSYDIYSYRCKRNALLQAGQIFMTHACARVLPGILTSFCASSDVETGKKYPSHSP